MKHAGGAHAEGITSACAESTFTHDNLLSLVWNHLRLRGEHRGYCEKHYLQWESPPLARRAPTHTGHDPALNGITSACAESTPTHRA